ncbi:hypothetical protein SCUCBS95973_002244 [Sporothrix curviconia]|uniref:C2H2-type domain-containing protein n=1 Tax=Sporothrix curviconia TaxID=1260050 RepID=A0ABP0B5G4_9PEZI
MTNPASSEHHSCTSAAAVAAQVWLDDVYNTPSLLDGLDFSADFVLGGVDLSSATSTAQGFVLADPPLFPPATAVDDFLSITSPIDAFSPPQSLSLSRSQQSFLSLSPSSSTTFDAADSLQSFDMASSFSQQEGYSATATGTMSDAEFQMLLGELSQDAMAAITMPMSLPCEPTAVDSIAQHAFAPLDMFSPSLNMAMLPLPVPESFPVPSPVSTSVSVSVPEEQPSPSQSVHCRTCHRAFLTPCRLRKHEHTHTRPFACDVCHKGHAAKKDLHRHLWTTHPETAEQMGIPCPMRSCPKCGFECRQDNLTRHMRKKHAGETV